MKLTPAMQQYVDLKNKHKDCVLFFRLGDFYETFFDDAHICSKILDIVLTSKNKKSDNPIPMAGIPFHSAEKYLTKLLDAGYKVAIAEQVGDVIPGQLVERKVTRVVTPGNRLDETSSDHHFLLALTHSDGRYHMARGDVSTGQFWTLSADLTETVRQLRLLTPAEVLLPLSLPDKESISSTLSTLPQCIQTLSHVPHKAEQELLTFLRVQSLASFGQAVVDGRQDALAMLLHYIIQTVGQLHVLTIQYTQKDQHVLVDEITYKNLEVFTSSYNNDDTYSLLGVLDTTVSAGGKRLLTQWLMTPTQDLQIIHHRHDLIRHYVQEVDMRHNARRLLRETPDGARVLSLLLMRDISVNQCHRLMHVLRTAVSLHDDLTICGLSQKDADAAHECLDLLSSVFVDDVHADHIIQPGYDDQLDAYKKLVDESDQLLLDYRQQLIQASGLTNIKIKYVKNQGYYVEVTPKDSEKFEKCFDNQTPGLTLIRRQTLKTGQRYSSLYLDELQGRVESAKDDYMTRQQEILLSIQKKIHEFSPALGHVNDVLSRLDVVASHAQDALDRSLIVPTLTHDKGSTDIKGARHLVIEHFLPLDQEFIPNDVFFSNKNVFHIITGPNMGGKSTFLRQNALIVLLAHCGLCVPAKKATISLVDGIFARVGSGDVIAKNQSTFMTEMIEVANIVHNATDRSFVIFDELGRGTSTYDGLALTQAIIDYLVAHTSCQTLIATHYHELIDFVDKYSSVANYSVGVHETDDDVVFLKKIVPGGADRSYGIDVAQRAGLPYEIIAQARDYLAHHQAGSSGQKNLGPSHASVPLFDAGDIHHKPHPVIETLRALDTNTMTPLEALQKLADLKKAL